MNNHQLQLRLQQQRLRQKPFKPIQLEDDNMFFLVQDGQIQQAVQQATIQIDSEEEYHKPKQELLQPRRTIAINEPIRPKLDVEYEEEPLRAPRLQVKEPVSQLKKIPLPVANAFEQVQKKIAQHSNIQYEAIQIVKPRDQQAPQNLPQIGYNQFKLLKLKEQSENQLKMQIEQEKKKYLMQKQAEKNAPTTKREGESTQEYVERMILQMKKVNKSTAKKVKTGDYARKQAKISQPSDDSKAVENLMKLYNGETISFDGITAPEIKPPPILLNYDVLFKTTKIIKQALQKPPESEQNPMLPLYKGRYAAEFIFSGGDFTDGPYGSKPRKAPKLPFPKHRLTLQPWEYYGVSPDEYFATKDPHFSFKAKYVPVREFYNELPRPKAEPRYYQFDVDSILAKRYSDKHTEYQYQATYVGYKQKHWTPIYHLKIKCPKAILDYEIHERNRLFYEIMNVKVKKVKISFSTCMLSHKFLNGKKETPQVVYIKGNTTQTVQQKRISNLEVERKEQEPQYEEPELSDDGKKKRTSKETRMMEDEWDPTKDDTQRARRNQQRKEKMEKHLEEAAKKAQEIAQLKEKGEYQPRSKSKSRKVSEKSEKKKANITQQIQEEINQFDSQFQESQPFQQEEQSVSEEEQQQRYLTEDDLKYSSKLQQLCQERKQKPNDMDVDLNQSMMQFNIR